MCVYVCVYVCLCVCVCMHVCVCVCVCVFVFGHSSGVNINSGPFHKHFTLLGLL